jgi:hypothetical protein
MASQFHHNGAGGSSTAVLEMESIPMTPLNLNNKGSGENFSITTPPDSLNVTRRASTDEESVPGPGAGAVAEVKERWNYPRTNIPRVGACFYSFIVMGANDAAYGVSCCASSFRVHGATRKGGK